MTDRHRTTVDLTVETHQRLRILAAAKGKTLGSLVNEAAETYLRAEAGNFAKLSERMSAAPEN